MRHYKHITLNYYYSRQEIDSKLRDLGYEVKGDYYIKVLKKDRLRILIDNITLMVKAEKISIGDYLKKWKPTRLKRRYLKELKPLIDSPKNIINYNL